MKKKILLIASMIAVVACLFAISVSAENKIIKLNTCPTLEEIHANRDAYVSHLDAFDGDSYGELDSESVVVLCDSNDLKVAPTYYYVFPSYYYARNTSNIIWDRLTMLNEAIAAADSTAFASYSAINDGWDAGSCKYLVRYEVPTYVTSITKSTKFEYSVNLKEIYFPTKTVVDEETGLEKEVTCVTYIEGQNTFTGCSSLETVHNFDKLPLGIYNSGAFSGCYPLTGIQLHKGITSIPNGMFQECRALNNLVFPDGITSIGPNAFENCNAMTEVILPNSVVSIGKKTFAYMDNLETISFGARLSKLTSSDHNLELLDGCPKLKYVYMPSCFATEVQNTGNGILRTGTNVTIFFTGTFEQAEAIKAKLPANGNPLIANAEFMAYNPDINYFENAEGVNYAQTYGKTILVYNYSACEAFYNGTHDVAENFTIEYSGEQFLSDAIKSKACSKCIFKVDRQDLAPLFECLGYSTFVDGSIMQGYKLNKNELSAYEDVIGKVEYGVVAAADLRAEEERAEGADVFLLEKSLSQKLSSSPHDYFEIKLSGITEELEENYFFLCAYLKFGEDCYYISNGACGKTATSTTFKAHKK